MNIKDKSILQVNLSFFMFQLKKFIVGYNVYCVIYGKCVVLAGMTFFRFCQSSIFKSNPNPNI